MAAQAQSAEADDAQREYLEFAELSSYAMAWLLLRKVSAQRAGIWKEYGYSMRHDGHSPGTAARALRIWLQLDIACEALRKVVSILGRFHPRDSVDRDINAKALQEGVEWSTDI